MSGHGMQAKYQLADVICDTQAALLWVSTLPGVTVDAKHIAAVGISDGGAPAIATGTRYTQFTHGMTLHGKCASATLPGIQRSLASHLCPADIASRRPPHFASVCASTAPSEYLRSAIQILLLCTLFIASMRRRYGLSE
jgi:hypothetical protein